MDAAPPPDDPLLHLPRSVYYQVVHDLHRSLPKPADETEDALYHRIHAAIAAVASMLPANAEEATIAARCVGAHAQAMDNLRLARLHPDDTDHVLRCSAQSAAMMRSANSARSLLLRVQAARHKREADPAVCNQAAWTEHCALGLMTNALDEAAPAPTAPPPEPVPAAQPERDDTSRQLTEAERYALRYPQQAAQIRATGRQPDDCDELPPALVQGIITSISPILLKLDRQNVLVPA